jgi:hypothetical protein
VYDTADDWSFVSVGSLNKFLEGIDGDSLISVNLQQPIIGCHFQECCDDLITKPRYDSRSFKADELT